MGKREADQKYPVNAKRPCASDALNFSELPQVQSAVEESRLVDYPCFTPLPTDDEMPLEFRLDKTDQYTDLSKTTLYIKVQILYKDGTSVASDDLCAFVNNIGYALFDSVDLYISDQKISKPESHYAWWTYVYNQIYFGDHATKTYLKAGNCWVNDTPGFSDDVGTEAGTFNKGLRGRHSRCGDSKTIWLATKLLINTPLDRLVPSQTEIAIRFNRSSTNSCLMASNDKEYKIRIHEAKIQTTRVRLFSDASKSYENKLEKSGFLYPMLSPVVRTKTVSAGDQNFDHIFFNGKLPQRIFLWQILQKAYNGEIDKNQYNFQPFGINKIQIFKNGRSLPSGQGLANIQSQSYLNVFMATADAINSPDTFKIEYDTYANGYFLVAIDISADFSAACEYDNVEEYGSLRVVIDYKEPVAEAITVFCMGEVQEVLQIDRNRNPSFL